MNDYMKWILTETGKQGLEQKDLQGPTGLSPSLISAMKNGKRKITAENAIALARGLKLDIIESLWRAGFLEDPEAAALSGRSFTDPRVTECVETFVELPMEARERVIGYVHALGDKYREQGPNGQGPGGGADAE